ncbi:MAG: hypothetical protein ACYDEY_09255 [Acidimicrobiales bacterium]
MADGAQWHAGVDYLACNGYCAGLGTLFLTPGMKAAALAPRQAKQVFTTADS